MSLSNLVVTDALIPRPAPHENHSALLPLTLAILLHAAIVAAFLAYVPRPLPLVDEPLTVTMIFAAAAPPAPPQPKAQPAFPSPPAATPPPPKPAPPQPAPEPVPAVLREPHPVALPPVKRVPSPPKRAAEPRPVQHLVRHQPARNPERRYPARPAYPEAAATAQHSNAPPTPAAPVGAPISAPVSAPISAGWRTALITWLARHKTYPEAARRDGIQGRVVVRFTAARDGRVETIALLQSSGQRILDDAAETMLRHARLPPFPASMPQRSITVTLPLTYHLEN